MISKNGKPIKINKINRSRVKLDSNPKKLTYPIMLIFFYLYFHRVEKSCIFKTYTLYPIYLKSKHTRITN